MSSGTRWKQIFGGSVVLTLWSGRLHQCAAGSSHDYNFSVGPAARINCWQLPSRSWKPLDVCDETSEHVLAVFVMTEPGEMVPEPEHYHRTTVSRQDGRVPLRDTVSAVASLYDVGNKTIVRTNVRFTNLQTSCVKCSNISLCSVSVSCWENASCGSGNDRLHLVYCYVFLEPSSDLNRCLCFRVLDRMEVFGGSASSPAVAAVTDWRLSDFLKVGRNYLFNLLCQVSPSVCGSNWYHSCHFIPLWHATWSHPVMH